MQKMTIAVRRVTARGGVGAQPLEFGDECARLAILAALLQRFERVCVRSCKVWVKIDRGNTHDREEWKMTYE